MRAVGRALLAIIVVVAVASPWLAPNSPDRQFDTYLYAPPTPLHATSSRGSCMERARRSALPRWRRLSR